MYNKNLYLKFLGNPYRTMLQSGQKSSSEMRRLKSGITRLNNRTKKPGDWIQSKYQFKDKIQNYVTVPKTYFYGNDITKITESLTKLNEFVLKPNHLSRGIGIRVLKRQGNDYLDRNGDVLTLQDLLDECKVMIHLKRYKGVQGIIIEEIITTHPTLNPNGYADIRMIYYRNRFLFCVGRFGNKKSSGYGNTNRGSNYGSYIGGIHVNDGKFITSGEVPSKIPFFNEMVLEGQKVTRMFGFAFMSVDMTVDVNGRIIIVESEQLPQIQYYLSPTGVRWLREIMDKDFKIAPRQNNRSHLLSAYFPVKVPVSRNPGDTR